MKILQSKLRLKIRLSPLKIGFIISLIVHLCLLWFFLRSDNKFDLSNSSISQISFNLSKVDINTNLKKEKIHKKKKISKKNKHLKKQSAFKEKLENNVLDNKKNSYDVGDVSVDDAIHTIANSDNIYRTIKGIINKNLPYPRMARIRNIQGNVIVEFILFKNGNVDNIRILQGAHSILDNNTINTIKEASREFPKPDKNIKLKIEIKYELT